MSAPLRARLVEIAAKSRVLDSPAERIAHAHDASFYRLVPKAVVFPASESEVARLFALSHELNLPLTFRAAGTSLSGQAITDGLANVGVARLDDERVKFRSCVRVVTHARR